MNGILTTGSVSVDLIGHADDACARAHLAMHAPLTVGERRAIFASGVTPAAAQALSASAHRPWRAATRFPVQTPHLDGHRHSVRHGRV